MEDKQKKREYLNMRRAFIKLKDSKLENISSINDQIANLESVKRNIIRKLLRIYLKQIMVN